MTARRRAVVAMSGGVDSSVAAALMVDAGYDVTGVMLKLWRGEEVNHNSGCCNVGAADDARRVADVLDIPFYVFNFAERFEESVVRSFRDDYAAGRTPNPCVRCNQWIKFDALLGRARAMGADVLVTGHYARVRQDGGRFRLLRGVDARKDQSYVLWMLAQDELAACRFPIGDMQKSETRAIAAELGLRTAAKPDSQEICFVRGGDVAAYVDEHVAAGAAPGPVVDTSGRKLGEHAGIAKYTVGQRRGLGISLGVPLYVTHVDAAANAIVVGERRDLAVVGLTAHEVSYVDRPPSVGALVRVQHRAHGETAPAVIESVEADGFGLSFPDPIEAVAPGQSVVLYDDADPDVVVGGGIIATTTPARAVA